MRLQITELLMIAMYRMHKTDNYVSFSGFWFLELPDKHQIIQKQASSLFGSFILHSTCCIDAPEGIIIYDVI